MSGSLKGCESEHTELLIHFESFNDECAIVKEVQVSFKTDYLCLKTDTFSIS